MKLVQFAVPERVGTICAEVAAAIAGGATLIPGMGWWVDNRGEVQRESVSWLVVGTPEDKINELISNIKSILKTSNESAVFYVVGSEPKLEWL